MGRRINGQGGAWRGGEIPFFSFDIQVLHGHGQTFRVPLVHLQSKPKSPSFHKLYIYLLSSTTTGAESECLPKDFDMYITWFSFLDFFHIASDETKTYCTFQAGGKMVEGKKGRKWSIKDLNLYVMQRDQI